MSLVSDYVDFYPICHQRAIPQRSSFGSLGTRVVKTPILEPWNWPTFRLIRDR